MKPEPCNTAQGPRQRHVGPVETFQTRSLRGTIALGKRLARRFHVGDCIALQGRLGAGKTALARGIALGLGLRDRRLVSSPTFVLVREYPCDVPVYHVDLYRMSEPGAELAELGLEEMIADGVVLIEWADRAVEALPERYWRIEIEMTGRRVRQFAVSRVT